MAASAQQVINCEAGRGNPTCLIMRKAVKIVERFTEPMKTVSAYGHNLEVPVWANWLAIDHDTIFAYFRKPKPIYPYHANTWETKSKSKIIAFVDSDLDWDKTLIRLP